MPGHKHSRNHRERFKLRPYPLLHREVRDIFWLEEDCCRVTLLIDLPFIQEMRNVGDMFRERKARCNLPLSAIAQTSLPSRISLGDTSCVADVPAAGDVTHR